MQEQELVADHSRTLLPTRSSSPSRPIYRFVKHEISFNSHYFSNDAAARQTTKFKPRPQLAEKLSVLILCTERAAFLGAPESDNVSMLCSPNPAARTDKSGLNGWRMVFSTWRLYPVKSRSMSVQVCQSAVRSERPERRATVLRLGQNVHVRPVRV
ncbi:uncharacterized protein BDW70DRAFT_57778 [Aspergillus foveolatus]|uniref:uncharacterized protein n=1 Tax=Aspergillus foveolatus TaxID=210207 RepID=UPI003CCCE9D8